MPQKTNLNVAPYYDDFAQDKNFYKVLFRPGYSIQARELTQLQSILQNQIESFGKYAFKQGELVIPGEVGLNTKLNFVKLSSVSEIPVNQDGQVVYKKYDIKSLKGQLLKGLTSGVTGNVVEAEIATETASDVIYINYTNSGDAGNEDTFRQGETLEVVDGVNTPLLVVGTDGSVLPTSISITDPDTGASTALESPAMGYASAVKVEEGIYFVNGHFVRNDSQLVVVDKYYDKPSTKVGFKIEESIITAEEDESLYDNAIGSSNYTAPGANRLKITLTLIQYALDQITDKNFIQLLTVRKGSVQSQVVQTDYNLLEQTLARRTYDESGDYVVDNFSLDIREYHKQGGNLGVYSADAFGKINGLTTTEADDKLVASVGPGKAYVKGYEIVNKETKYYPIDKARETLDRADIRLKTQGLPTYNVTNVYGTVPLNAQAGIINSPGTDLTAYPNVFLCSTFNDGSIGLNNSEGDTDIKQTLDRRGKFLDVNAATKTIYLKVNSTSTQLYNNLGLAAGVVLSVTPGSYTGLASQAGTHTVTPEGGSGNGLILTVTIDSNGAVTGVAISNGGVGYADSETVTCPAAQLGTGASTSLTVTLQSVSDINWQNTIGELWYVFARDDTDTPNDVQKITSLAFSKVNRKEVSTSTSDTYLELTISGEKDSLLSKFLDYDDGESTKLRKLFLTEADAKVKDNTTFFGHIVDYNEVITPVIGTAKPSNITLVERGTGFNVDTDIVVSRGRSSDGKSTYNSTFGLSYFDPQFFTKILLDEPNTDLTTFTPGMYVYGLESGAYGVVEGESYPSGKYSTKNVLMVKTIFGNFKSGEAIRDEANNTKRIAKDNTISHFIVPNRGGNYATGTTISIDGIDYGSDKVSVGLTGGGIYKVSIEDRESFKTEYSKPPVVIGVSPGGTPTAAIIIPVLVRDAVTTYTPQNVKSFFCKFSSGNENLFTSDIEVNKETYSEVTSITNSTFSGDQGRKYIECNGFGGDATKSLQQGDLIQFTDTEDRTLRAIVQQATKPQGIYKSRIYLDRSLPASLSNASVVRIRPSINNFNKGTLLYKTGTKQVSSVVAGSEDSKITYYLRKDFTAAGAAGTGGGITFVADLPYGTQRFVSFSESNFLVTVLNKGITTGTSLVEDGDVLYLRQDQVSIASSIDSASGLQAGSVTLNLPSNFFGPAPSTYSKFPTLKVTATLEVTKAKPRLKTSVTNKRIVIDSVGDKVTPLRGKDYDQDTTDVFSYADAYKLRYIYEGTISAAPSVDINGNIINGTDVTDRFTFDDGQRDTVYDISRIVLKPGAESPIGKLLVAFDYFEHTQGDFCTVDSYLHEAGVGSEDIPSFNSPALGKVSLSDVLDFRPKVDNDCITSGFNNNALLSASNTRSFTGAGGVVTSTPAPDSNLEYTFSFTQTQFLNRIDALFLNKKGEFIVKKGNSSLNPSKPDPISDAISLYYMYIPAYTYNSKDVRIVPVDNKRYTMRDIGKLEKRIERLEYYTTLSILEQQALNMHVTDSNGINRFKSGFIVDNFETHKIGSLQSLDYKCSIDTQQSVMRPQSNEDSVGLKEVNTREDQRTTSGYVRNGDRVTLPYSELELLGNSFATRTINPNPFVVLQYVGDSFIGPVADSWYDSSTAPLITDNNTNLYSIFIAKNKVRDAFSSLYNSYKINWLGADRAFFNIGSFADVNSDVSDSSVTEASVGSSSNISPENNEVGKGLVTKGVGSTVVATSLSFFARSIPVKFVINRLKPNTNISVFMEGQDISRWVNPDFRYTGVAGNSLSTFNSSIVTDSNGSASGIILIPCGKPPTENSTWTGNVDTVVYDNDADEIKFTSGIKTIRFTSSSTDANKDTVETYAEVQYYATGVLPENPSSIVSTTPAYFKANEGTQLTDSNTANPIRPNPLAQTFTVEGFEGGVFTTGIDLFFNKKSNTIPIRVYLTDVQNSKPGKNIIPGTQTVVSPDTYLRVVASDTLTIIKAEKVTGTASNASGPISRVIDRNGIEVAATSTGQITLTSDQVYTLVLDNHNGTEFVQDEILSVPSITQYNNSNNTSLSLKIVKDSGRVTSLNIKNTGYDYDSAVVTIESPQLPGGGNATATVRVSGKKVYHSELILAGSEYTEPPAVVIRGTGTGNAGAEIESFITIDSPAVRMGISIDEDGTTQSITPTKFKFNYPVYLQNDTEYALAIETDSVEYEIWASKLGETEIATSTTVTTQPSLGSLFKSQNTNAWTEDLFEDVKFSLHRAEFNINRDATLLLTNEDLGYELLDVDPIETDSSSDAGSTSALFRNNNIIVKVNHFNNGFEDNNSHVFFKGIVDVGGLTSSKLNTELYKVTNVGTDHYNITTTSRATSNAIGGGTNVLASYNRKFEKLHAVVPNLTFSTTSIDTEIKTTPIAPIDDNLGTFTSYDQTNNYEKTFLNEDFFFINQKVIASKINQTVNNIDRSLEYKLTLKSDVSHLSPFIDLSRASLKLISNRIENAKGKENRFGRRNQLIEFYDIYTFQTSGVDIVGGESIDIFTTVTGQTSNASGEIVKVNDSTIWVKLKTVAVFTAGEKLTFEQSNTAGRGFAGDVSISSSGTTPVSKVEFQIPWTTSPPTYITARNPSRSWENNKLSEEYTGKISGRIVLWNPITRVLEIVNDKNPINDDYTSPWQSGSLARTENVSDMANDVFRVNDIIAYTGQTSDMYGWIEVSKVSYTDGVEFTSENESKNSSSLAKYVTKEVSIENPGTSINVKMTANTTEIENIKLLYRIKKSSSQENFDDIEWIHFNDTGLPDVDVIATAENSISGITEKQSSYQELSYSVEDLPEFSSFAIKVVMKSSNPAFVPKIQDLRAVASY